MRVLAAVYMRVSTHDQTTENQRLELMAYAKRQDWDVKVFEDAGLSGAKGRDKRPALDALLKAVALRQVDVVLATSVDRLGRSLQGLVAFLAELHAAGVDLVLLKQGLNTQTPAGKALFQLLGVFAEFERAIIQERIRSGLARAKAEGKRLGRPTVLPGVEASIRGARQSGMGIRRISRALNVGTSVVQRVVAQMGGTATRKAKKRP